MNCRSCSTVSLAGPRGATPNKGGMLASQVVVDFSVMVLVLELLLLLLLLALVLVLLVVVLLTGQLLLSKTGSEADESHRNGGSEMLRGFSRMGYLSMH